VNSAIAATLGEKDHVVVNEFRVFDAVKHVVVGVLSGLPFRFGRAVALNVFQAGGTTRVRFTGPGPSSAVDVIASLERRSGLAAMERGSTRC